MCMYKVHDSNTNNKKSIWLDINIEMVDDIANKMDLIKIMSQLINEMRMSI